MKMRIASVVAALFMGASAAQADTVDVRFLGTGQGKSVKIDFNGKRSNVFSGQLRHELSNGTGVGARFHGEHLTYCSDLAQYVTSTRRTYQVTPIQNLPGGGAMGADRAQAIHDLYAFADKAQLAPGANADFAAAFQIAVWEVVYDYNVGAGLSSLSTTSGTLKVFNTNGQALSAAIRQNLVNFFNAVVNTHTTQRHVLGLSSGSYQDQMVFVPLPAPALMGLAGLGALALIRRRPA